MCCYSRRRRRHANEEQKAEALAEVLFAPMIDWVIGAAKESGIDDICVVKGFGAEYLDAHLAGSCETVLQSERLGTGHAVLQAGNFIESNGGDVLVLNGDAPFIDAKQYTMHSPCTRKRATASPLSLRR